MWLPFPVSNRHIYEHWARKKTNSSARYGVGPKYSDEVLPALCQPIFRDVFWCVPGWILSSLQLRVGCWSRSGDHLRNFNQYSDPITCNYARTAETGQKSSAWRTWDHAGLLHLSALMVKVVPLLFGEAICASISLHACRHAMSLRRGNT